MSSLPDLEDYHHQTRYLVSQNNCFQIDFGIEYVVLFENDPSERNHEEEPKQEELNLLENFGFYVHVMDYGFHALLSFNVLVVEFIEAMDDFRNGEFVYQRKVLLKAVERKIKFGIFIGVKNRENFTLVKIELLVFVLEYLYFSVKFNLTKIYESMTNIFFRNLVTQFLLDIKAKLLV